MELASRNLTKIVLELGGKDPMIVLRDADLELAARGAVWEAFMNSGQSCASVERVYVDSRIAEEFKKRVIELTNIKFVCADFSKKHSKQWWYPYTPSKLPIMEKSLALMHHRRRGEKAKALLTLLPHMGAVSSTTPFRSLLKITSCLFRS